MKTQTVYFPNLNGLRFIAAFLVIVHHLEQIKSLLDLPNNYNSTNSIHNIIGPLGVIFFLFLVVILSHIYF